MRKREGGRGMRKRRGKGGREAELRPTHSIDRAEAGKEWTKHVTKLYYIYIGYIIFM